MIEAKAFGNGDLGHCGLVSHRTGGSIFMSRFLASLDLTVFHCDAKELRKKEGINKALP